VSISAGRGPKRRPATARAPTSSPRSCNAKRREGLMPYDDQLAQRVRDVLRQRQDVAERKMFGGVAFLVNGNMCCGVNGELLVLRLGPEGAEEALGRPHTRAMDFTGKAIKSMIYVEADGVASDTELRSWVEWALDHAQSLPPK